MTAVERGRGQPLLVMAVILGSWLAVRAVLWEVPGLANLPPVAWRADRDATRREAARSPAANAGTGVAQVRAQSGAGPPQPLPAKTLVLLAAPGPHGREIAPFGRTVLSGALPPSPGEGPHAEPARAAPLSAARFEGVEEQRAPAPARAVVGERPLIGFGPARDQAAPAPWSGDAWVLWRDGSGAAVAPGIASYGRSQAGAVLRYRFDRTSASRPAAYLRVTSALQSPRQAEIAAGVALRPVPAVPLVLAAEGRVTDTGEGQELRPAAFAVTELPPASLPLGLRGEAYVQAGYVGGQYRTAFVDGQARIDRLVARAGRGDGLRVGVAAWGGAQRDTSRLDAGPSATLGFKVGDASARLAADYRFRIAGDAAPASGPALTFSAGF